VGIEARGHIVLYGAYRGTRLQCKSEREIGYRKTKNAEESARERDADDRLLARNGKPFAAL